MKKYFFITLALAAVLSLYSHPKENQLAYSDEDTSLMAEPDDNSSLTEVADTPAKEEKEWLPLEKTLLTSTATKKLLVQYDLSPLWIPSAEESSAQVLNGFYDTDHYRIEMYLRSIEKDQQNPAIYHLKGKTRLMKNIVSFEGIVKFDAVTSFKDLNNYIGEVSNKGNGLFTTTGTFEFKETSSFPGSGVFYGKVSMDFKLNTDNELEDWYADETATRRCGLLLDGTWKSNKTGKMKPVVLANRFIVIADSVLKNFNVGERMIEINPKYRSLGWDTYWSNEEWWHEREI